MRLTKGIVDRRESLILAIQIIPWISNNFNHYYNISCSQHLTALVASLQRVTAAFLLRIVCILKIAHCGDKGSKYLIIVLLDFRGGASRQIRGVPTKPFWVRVKVKVKVRVGLWFG